MPLAGQRRYPALCCKLRHGLVGPIERLAEHRADAVVVQSALVHLVISVSRARIRFGDSQAGSRKELRERACLAVVAEIDFPQPVLRLLERLGMRGFSVARRASAGDAPAILVFNVVAQPDVVCARSSGKQGQCK